jgi:Uma2 family endonuclease
MSTISAGPAIGQHLLLYNVDWRTYSRLLRIFAEQRGIRLAYDRGRLEIMRPLFEQEIDVAFLDRLVIALTEELGLTIRQGGSTTIRRRRKWCGIEPDRCHWIANEPKLRGKRSIDFRIDPPPDLAIEVDVTSSSLNPMGIYATLGVPEVWRFEDPTLTFHALGANRKYSVITHSLSFPLVTPADLMNFLPLRATQDENSVVRQFRGWIQQRIAAGGATPATP